MFPGRIRAQNRPRSVLDAYSFAWNRGRRCVEVNIVLSDEVAVRDIQEDSFVGIVRHQVSSDNVSL